MSAPLTAIPDILTWLRARDTVLVTTHRNADGDALGSALAVAGLLRAWGKRHRVVLHDNPPAARYDFLPGREAIATVDACVGERFDAAVTVDVPSLERIGSPAELLPPPEHCLSIDHHPPEDRFAAHTLVDTTASSAGILVYELLLGTGIDFTPETATCLYAAISYDTGRFAYDRTSPRDFEAAAHCVSAGASASKVANAMFFRHRPAALRAMGEGLRRLELHGEGRICLIALPLDVFATAADAELEELAAFSIMPGGVEVGLFVRAVQPDRVKVSLRSTGGVDVSVIARIYGGGGHRHAAGCRLAGSLAAAVASLLPEVLAHLDERETGP